MVVSSVIEQWENLRAYFLQFLPKKNFKHEIKTTHCYVNIKEILEYESFLLPFQSQESMIPLLYHGISRLLTNMLKNFVSKRVLYREDRVTMNPATQLKLINLNKETNLKSLNLIEVGTKEKRLLSASILGETVFRKNCLKFYISPAT